MLVRKKLFCYFCKQKSDPDYKEPEVIARLISERGKILGAMESGICRKHQKRLTIAIKRARYLALLPFIVRPS